MIAYITSIGETTTDLCRWSLIRNGFKPVVVVKGGTSLAMKLHHIYNEANDDFVRVDADVIPNKNLTPGNLEAFRDPHVWWMQYQCFDWFQQAPMYGGIQYIKKEALPILKANISQYINFERPESAMFRLAEFHNPRRCESYEFILGLHGYKQDNIKRVRDTKMRRDQMDNYDFELAERIEAL